MTQTKLLKPEVGLISLSFATHRPLWDQLEATTALRKVELRNPPVPGAKPKFGTRNYVMDILLASLLGGRKINGVLDEVDVCIAHTHSLLPILLHRRIRRLRGRTSPPIASIYLSFRSTRLLSVYSRIARWLGTENLSFLADGNAVVETTANYFDVPLEAVTPVGLAIPDTCATREDRGYIFSGGYTNRDFTTLIEAVRDTNHELVLCVVKENKLPESIPPNVKLVYNETPAEFSSWLSGACVGVVPLYAGRGGAGYTIIAEHFMNAQATIVSDEKMNGYVDDDSCILVPPENAPALRRAIDELMNSEPTRRAMGLAGRKLYDRRFSPEAVATKILIALDLETP